MGVEIGSTQYKFQHAESYARYAFTPLYKFQSLLKSLFLYAAADLDLRQEIDEQHIVFQGGDDHLHKLFALLTDSNSVG